MSRSSGAMTRTPQSVGTALLYFSSRHRAVVTRRHITATSHMTTIGPGIDIKGEIVSDEDLVLEGGVSGQVLLRDATLTVARQARITADLRSTRVHVFGSVQGNIAATERIELTTTASVVGNLSANQVVLQEGATFNGRIDMDRRTIAAKVAQYKAAQTA
jgi:cytoskeletal protein CcmA (bactofilin family)